MKIIGYNLFKSILWYTIIVNSLVFIIDFYNFFNSFFTDGYPVLLLLLTLIIIELLLLFSAIKLLRNQYSKFLFRIVLFYWIAQIIIFGFKGYIYAFTTGPELAFYLKYVGYFESGYFFKIFTRELTIHLFSEGERIYFGINLIPILISIALIYLSKKNCLRANGLI